MRSLLPVMVLSLLPISWLPAAAPPQEPEVLERFTVAGDGDLLLVPVTIKGKSYPFILDTGCTATCCDTSLRHLLGPRIGYKEIKGTQSTVNLESYPVPEAFVGKLPLPRTDIVVLHDFAPARRATSLNIRGCLGMDFLKHYVVRIDFDAGVLTFQNRIGRLAGQPLRLHSGEITDVPYVDADVCDSSPPERFEVDTGSCGGEGDLGTDVFDALAALGKLRRVGQIRVLALKESSTSYGELGGEG